MIKDLLNAEGPFIGFLDKVGQLIALSFLWLLGSLPLITLGTSTAAFYYGVIKSVRRGQGSAVQEFRRSYRANLGRGIVVTLTGGTLGSILMLNLRLLQGHTAPVLAGGAVLGLGLLACAAVYICPVLSRFSMNVWRAWMLAMVMSLRFLPVTLLILLAASVGAAAQIWFLPIPAMLVLPGAMCLLATFPMEKALRKYMPEKDENDNAWYYES